VCGELCITISLTLAAARELLLPHSVTSCCCGGQNKDKCLSDRNVAAATTTIRHCSRKSTKLS